MCLQIEHKVSSGLDNFLERGQRCHGDQQEQHCNSQDETAVMLRQVQQLRHDHVNALTLTSSPLQSDIQLHSLQPMSNSQYLKDDITLKTKPHVKQ